MIYLIHEKKKKIIIIVIFLEIVNALNLIAFCYNSLTARAIRWGKFKNLVQAKNLHTCHKWHILFLLYAFNVFDRSIELGGPLWPELYYSLFARLSQAVWSFKIGHICELYILSLN